MVVMRGPDWKWADEDGGKNELGDLVAINEKTRTATVRWRCNNKIFGHYRLDKCKDLCRADGVNGFMVQPVLVTKLFTPKRGSQRALRDSQGTFADPQQTVIVFDWDDTLFPTSWIRASEAISWRRPMNAQQLGTTPGMKEITAQLDNCCNLAASLLRVSDTYGYTIIVTLAKPHWVTNSCDFFYKTVGSIIRQLKIPVVYAREFITQSPEALRAMNEAQTMSFWSDAKGMAIKAKVESIYSQYPGQTWKNVISIGDSNFEREGTRAVIRQYLDKMGVHSLKSGGLVEGEDPHIVRVRTKTCKLVDSPNLEELATELGLLTQWLPLMACADHSLDIDLDAMEGAPHTWGVEDMLRNGNHTTSAKDYRPSTLDVRSVASEGGRSRFSSSPTDAYTVVGRSRAPTIDDEPKQMPLDGFCMTMDL